MALGAGIFFFTWENKSDVQIISSDTEKEAFVLVDVGGAVARPGVYRVGGDLRVQGALEAAGGMTAEADSAKVNLAARVSDGQKVYVPAKQEQVVSEKGEVISKSQNTLISINMATVQELDTLPGVGIVTAQKIIAGRPYASIDEVLSKKAVSSGTFEKIKGLITY